MTPQNKMDTRINTTALFPTFKCDAGELQILTAMVDGYHESKVVDSSMGVFKSSPWIFSMELMNAGATDEDAMLSIETGTSVPLCEIVGNDYWESLDDDQRVAVGPSLIRMLDHGLLSARFAVDVTDKARAKTGSKKKVTKK